MNLKFYIICLLIVVVSACQNNEPENPVVFRQCAAIPVARASATAFVVGDKAYVFGGRTATESGYLNDFWEYNAATDTWTQKSNVPFKARVKATAQVVNGKVYCGLGFNGRINTDSCYLRDWWCYEPQTDKWTHLADYPTSRTNMAITYVLERKIYLCFGSDSGPARDIYEYDIDTNTWKVWPDNWHRETLGASVGATCRSRYFFGTGYFLGMSNHWYEFFPERDFLAERQPLPDNGRIFASAAVLNDRLFVFGGRYFGGTLTSEVFYNDLLEYDLDTDKWILRGFLPQGGRESMICFTLNDKVYFGTGADCNGQVCDELYTFELP